MRKRRVACQLVYWPSEARVMSVLFHYLEVTTLCFVYKRHWNSYWIYLLVPNVGCFLLGSVSSMLCDGWETKDKEMGEWLSAWFPGKEAVNPMNSHPHAGDPGKLMDDFGLKALEAGELIRQLSVLGGRWCRFWSPSAAETEVLVSACIGEREKQLHPLTDLSVQVFMDLTEGNLH